MQIPRIAGPDKALSRRRSDFAPRRHFVANKPVAGLFKKSHAVPRSNQRNLLNNRRILLVDDDIHTLRRQKARLETLCPLLVVDIEIDSSRVVERVLAARNEAKPYHVLVTDLSMKSLGGGPGIDGDDLLREMSKAACLLPTIIYSGSWAHNIQGPLAAGLDILRGRLSVTGNPCDGVPFLQIRKFDSELDTDPVWIQALIAVQQIAEKWDKHETKGFIEGFKPERIEIDINSKLNAQLIETIRNIGILAQLISADIQAAQDQSVTVVAYMKIAADAVSDLASNLSFQKLDRESDWRNFLHNFHNAIGNLRDFIKDGVDLGQGVENFRELLTKYNTLQLASRQESGQTSSLGKIIRECKIDFFRERMSTAPQFKPNPKFTEIGTTFSPDIQIYGCYSKLINFLTHPLQNAVKAVKQRQSEITDSSYRPQVQVHAKTVQIQETPREVQSYFNNKSYLGALTEITIEDNGVGMPQDRVNQINNRQMEEGTSSFGTAGWGMSIMQDLASDVGTYSVTSQEGSGTSFKIWVQAESASA